MKNEVMFAEGKITFTDGLETKPGEEKEPPKDRGVSEIASNQGHSGTERIPVQESQPKATGEVERAPMSSPSETKPEAQGGASRHSTSRKKKELNPTAGISETISEEAVPPIPIVIKKPLREGDIFEHPESKDRMVVHDITKKDGESVIAFTETYPHGEVKNKKRVLQKSLRNFNVRLRMEGMQKIDTIQDSHPEFYAAYGKEMTKAENAFIREYEALGGMMDAWKDAIENEYSQDTEESTAAQEKQKEKQALMEDFDTVRQKIEAIGEAWNKLDERVVESGLKKISLLYELRSICSKDAERIPEDALRFREEELEKMKKEQGAIEEPDSERIEAGYQEILQERELQELQIVQERETQALLLLLGKRVKALQKKYDQARAGYIDVASDAPDPDNFVQQVNVLFASVKQGATPQDIKNVLVQLDELEKRVFIDANKGMNGDAETNGNRERKGKRARRFQEGSESRHFVPPIPKISTNRRENDIPAQAVRMQNIMPNTEVTPRELWDTIQQLSRFLKKEAERTANKVEASQRVEEIENLLHHAEQAHISITSGNDVELNKKVLKGVLDALIAMLPSQKNNPMRSKDLPEQQDLKKQEFLDAFSRAFEDLKLRISGAENFEALKALKPGKGKENYNFLNLDDFAEYLNSLSGQKLEAEREETFSKIISAEKELNGLYRIRMEKLKETAPKQADEQNERGSTKTAKERVVLIKSLRASIEATAHTLRRRVENDRHLVFNVDIDGESKPLSAVLDITLARVRTISDVYFEPGSQEKKKTGREKEFIRVLHTAKDELDDYARQISAAQGSLKKPESTELTKEELFASLVKRLKASHKKDFKQKGELLLTIKSLPSEERQEIEISYRNDASEQAWTSAKIGPNQVSRFLKQLETNFGWTIESKQEGSSVTTVAQEVQEAAAGRKPEAAPDEERERFIKLVTALRYKREPFGTGVDGKELIIESVSDTEIKYRYGEKKVRTAKPEDVNQFLEFLQAQFSWAPKEKKSPSLAEMKKAENKLQKIRAVVGEKMEWAKQFFADHSGEITEVQFNKLNDYLNTKLKEAEAAIEDKNLPKLKYVLQEVTVAEFKAEEAKNGESTASEQPKLSERKYEELVESMDSSELDELVGIAGTSLKLALEDARITGKTKKEVIDGMGVDVVIKEILAPAINLALTFNWTDAEKEVFAQRLAQERVELFVKEKAKK